MSFTFRPAKRENVPLLIGVAGGTGSGKTYSALLVARGLSGGQPFALVDTENGRAKHYADLFPEMRHGEIHAPFRPAKYADAIVAGAEEFGVVVVDSMSHEWAGDGGCLDWHDELMGGDQKKNLSAWIEPKRAHKMMVTRLLQVGAHVILCFRAEPKVEAVTENGRTKIIAKQGLTALDGWFPIAEKMLPYELTASFLLMADAPGVPKPIKLQEQHKPMVPLDRPLDEATGRALAEWAAGGTAPAPADTSALEHELVDVLREIGADHRFVDKHRGDAQWLERNLARAKERLAAVAADVDLEVQPEGADGAQQVEGDVGEHASSSAPGLDGQTDLSFAEMAAKAQAAGRKTGAAA